MLVAVLSLNLITPDSISSSRAIPSSGLKSESVAAFDRYAALTESLFDESRLSAKGPFLRIDTLPTGARSSAYASLVRGEIRIEKLQTLDNGRPIESPDALIHHWVGTIFIPGVTLQQTLQLVEDYGHQSKVYAPDVEESRTISHAGDDFHIFLRFRRTKVITAVLDTEHDVHYISIDATHAASRSVSTSIREVENPGTANERDLPQGTGGGYLWRINAYWKFLERDAGTYVECESISLTRDIPTGLGWIVGPFVTSIPRESLNFTLEATRKALTKK